MAVSVCVSRAPCAACARVCVYDRIGRSKGGENDDWKPTQDRLQMPNRCAKTLSVLHLSVRLVRSKRWVCVLGVCSEPISWAAASVAPWNNGPTAALQLSERDDIIPALECARATHGLRPLSTLWGAHAAPPDGVGEIGIKARVWFASRPRSRVLFQLARRRRNAPRASDLSIDAGGQQRRAPSDATPMPHSPTRPMPRTHNRQARSTRGFDRPGCLLSELQRCAARWPRPAGPWGASPW